MWKLDHNVGWALKNWCFRIVMLKKTLESLLDCKKIKPVNPKGNQSWILIGRIDAKSESEVAQSCLTLCNPMDCMQPKLLCPWDFPGKSTGVGCHFLLQGIFPTQELNPGLPHYKQMLYHLSHQGNQYFCWRSNILATWYEEPTHLDAEKDWKQKEKGTAEDEMVR